jgi:hypothetical protein
MLMVSSVTLSPGVDASPLLPLLLCLMLLG